MLTTTSAEPHLARRILGILLAMAMTAVLLPPLPAHAADPDPRITPLEEGLRAWAHAIDRSGELGPLAETIPLTVATPGRLAGFDGDVVRATLESALSVVPAGSNMDDFLDELDGQHLDEDDVTATFTVDAAEGSDDERADLTFDLHFEVTRTVDVPLFFDEGIDEAGDPELDGGLSTLFLHQGRIDQVETIAAGTYKFALNVDQGEEPEHDSYAFEIRDPLTAAYELTIGVAEIGGIAPFRASYGITDADAEATSEILDLQFTVSLVDPDASGTGTITLEELSDTNPLDLFTIDIEDGAVGIVLELTQEDLFTETGDWEPDDEVITLHATGDVEGSFPDDSGPFFPAPVDAIGDRFAPFGELTPDDVLVGLGEVALAIRAASLAGDVDLPLLAGSLTDAVDPGGKLLEFVRERSEVLIFCGSTNSLPPEGVPRDGRTAYCQAFANLAAEPGTVEWTLDGDPDHDDLEVPDDPDTTFGVEPEANIEVPTDRISDLRVTWEIPEADRSPDRPVELSGVPRFETLQELAVDLAASGYGPGAAEDLLEIVTVDGIGEPTDPIDVVTVDISTAIDEPVDLSWRVDDAFRPDARLNGVRTDDATTTVTPNGTLHATAGIVLDPSLPGPDVERDAADRELVEAIRGRFLLTDGADQLITVDAVTVADDGDGDTLATISAVPGRIGYLPVDVDLALSLATATGPALSVGIDPTTSLADDPDDVTIDRPSGDEGWVRVADLIAYLDPYGEGDDDPVAIPPRRGFDATVDLRADVAVTVRDRLDTSDYSDGLGLEEGFSASWTADATSTAAADEPLADKVPSRFTVERDGDFEAYTETLRPFDVAPEVRGVATGGDTTTLEADVDFADAFGVEPGTHIDATLTNTTQGGSCRGFTVETDPHRLVCDDPLPPIDSDDVDDELSDLEAMEWTAGDGFLVEGDPTALRRVSTRALRVGAGSLAVSENDALIAQLPQLDLRAAELLPLDDLADALDAFADAVEADQGEAGFEGTSTGAGIEEEGARAPDLARLLDELHGELVSEVSLEATESGTRAFSVGADRSDIDGVPHLVLDIEMTETDRTATAPIRLLTEEQGAVLEDTGGGDGSIEVTYDATVNVTIGVPIADEQDPRDIVILHDTGIDLTLEADTDDIDDIKLTVGGRSVQAGAGLGLVVGEAEDPGDADPTITLVDEDARFLDRDVEPGTQVRLFDGDDLVATCTVAGGTDAVTNDTVECAAPLAPEDDPELFEFTDGPSYEIVDDGGEQVTAGDVGNYGVDAAADLNAETDLYDPDGEFDDVEQGHVVRLLDSHGEVIATCVVDDVITHEVEGQDDHEVVRCADQLVAPGPRFDEGDPYEIDVEGVGSFALALDIELRHPDPGATTPATFRDEVVGTWTGARAAGCEADETACLELSLRTQEDDGDRMIAAGTLTYSVPHDLVRTATGSEPDATFEEDPTAPHAALPDVALADLDLRPLDFVNVATAGRFLEQLFADALDGDLTQTTIPLFGTHLDAGADVADVFADVERGLRGDLLDTQTDSLGDSLEAALESSPGDLDTFIENHVTSYLAGFLGAIEDAYLGGTESITDGTVGDYEHDDAPADLDPETDLFDPSGDFGSVEPGHVIRLVDDGTVTASCLVGDVDAGQSVVTCAQPLTPAGSEFTEGDAYEIVAATLRITPVVDVECDAPCDVLANVADVRIDLTFEVGSFAEGGDDIGCDPDQGRCVGGNDVAFDPGIAGLPVEQPPAVDGDRPTPIAVDHRWTVDLAIGLSRTEGPYLAPRGGDADDDATLTLGAFGRFAAEPEEGCEPGTSAATYADEIGFPLGDDPRCADALIGILPAQVYDGDGTGDETRRSAVEALVEVAAADGRVDFGELLDRRRAPVDVASRARINLLFESNAGDLYEAVFDSTIPGSMPAVVGTFHAFVNDHDAPDGFEPLYYYQALAFDPVPFLRDFLDPVAQTVKDLTDPFSPVLELVSTKIPVVSDLSELTGGGEVTILTLLEAVSGNDLEMLERLIESVDFANAIATIAGNDLEGFIPLGPETEDEQDIDLDGEGDEEDDRVLEVDWAQLDPDDDREVQGGGFFIAITDDEPGPPQAKKRDSEDKEAEKDADKDEKKADKKQVSKEFKKKVEGEGHKGEFKSKVNWSGTALTTPILDDPDEVFGMLLGRDAMLVRFDAGKLKASVSLSWTFGPFAAGPVLFDVGIGGSVSLEGRFAMGYDTYGFSRAVRGERAFLSPFLDGLFLDDLDADGNNVDEIKLITKINASAAVSIKIIRAGLEGEVTLTISFDLNDRRGDGRIRIEDIYRFRHDPICLFVTKGTLGFALNVFIEIKLGFKKKKKSFTIWELDPPLDLFEHACDPPEPVFGGLTNPDMPASDAWLPERDDDGAWDRAFKLHVGADADKRGLFPFEVDERFVVRQRSGLDEVDISEGDARDQLEALGIENTDELDSDDEVGTIIEVEGFGERLLYALPAGTIIWAETGAGDDIILLEPGTEFPIPDNTEEENEDNGENGDEQDEAADTHDFMIPAWIEAGNEIEGGATAHEDDLPGRNRFAGGDNNNVLIGFEGGDTLQGGRGDDTILGVGGDNTIEGSRGDNVLIGGSGNDRLSGGPGSDVIVGGGGDNTIEGGPGLRPGTEPDGRRDLVDTGNVLIGGPGSNSISGGPSTDYILAGGWPIFFLGSSDVPDDVSHSGVEALLHFGTAAVGGNVDHVDRAVDARTWALDLLDRDGQLRGDTLDRDLAGRLCRAADRVPFSTSPGDNVAEGYRGDDLVIGGFGNDDLEGGRDDDILCVPDGDNVLEAGRGNNELHGGAGNDRIIGGPGNDWLTGGGGENHLEAGGGRNLLIGGAGSDVLAGGQTGELLIADGGPPSGEPGIYLRDGVDGFVRVALGDEDPLTLGDWAPLIGDSSPDAFDYTVTGLYAETDDTGAFTDEPGALTACRPSAQVLADGRLDLEGDGAVTERGRFLGRPVEHGRLVTSFGGDNLDGLIAGVEVHDGRVDLNGDGNAGPQGRLAGGAVGYDDGDLDGAPQRANCVLGGDAPDAIFGGPAADHIHAGIGDDFVDAGPGDNLVRGGPGDTVLFGGPHANTIFGDSGDDAIFGGPGGDILDGGPGDDYIEGNEGDDTIRGGAGDDVLIGGSSGTADDIYVEAGPGDTAPRTWWSADLDSPSGNDTIFGETGDDLIVGDNVRIESDGRLSWWEPGDEDAWLTAAVTGDADFAGDDELHGGHGENVIIGGLGDDELHAGEQHSYLFGDLAWFWPTSERVDAWIGGQPAWHGVLFHTLEHNDVDAPAWWDVVEAGSSVEDPPYAIAPSEPGAATHWPGGAARYDVLLAAPNVGGADHLVGGPGDDHLFGGAGNDVLEGGAGDDYLEGGPGDDRLYGETEALALAATSPDAEATTLGALVESLFNERGGLLTASSTASSGNDLIGGSSSVHPDATDPDGPGAPSGRDIIVGADGEDVMLGDNGEIRGQTDGAGPGQLGEWAVDPITGGRARDVEPYDLHRLEDGYEIDPDTDGSGALGTLEELTRNGAGALDGSTTLGGDDVIVGIDGDNRIYGGPGDDYIRGGPGDDYAEGGPGDDWIEGGGGDDDLIGGSSFAADDSPRALATGNTTLGTEGFPSGANVLLGQGGQNVLAGDNARVLRAAPTEAADFDVYLATDGRFVGFDAPRWISLLDLDDPRQPTIGVADLLSAGPGNSLLFGQGGDDWASGGAGDDYVEGNAGDDVLLGDRPFGIGPAGGDESADSIATDALLAERPTIDRRGHTLDAFRWPADQRADDRYRNTYADTLGGTPHGALEGLTAEIEDIGDGQDDLIGGNSRAGLPAGNDTIYGDGGDDFLLGDNAAVIRQVDDDGEAYVRYDERYDPDFDGERTIVREVIEFDVGASLVDGGWRDTGGDVLAGAPFGDDFLDGGLGDDTLHGQDGDDELWGSPHHDTQDGEADGEIHPAGESWGDHLVGGLGDDALFGGPGNDVLIGDRGSIITVFLTGDDERVEFTRNGPPFMNFAGLEDGDLWHRVDLYCKEDRSPVADGELPRFFDHDDDACGLFGSDGLDDPDSQAGVAALTSLRYSHHTHGGDDLLRGGRGDTVIYGGGGNDVLQGDEGADILFGGRGSNVLYGGEGEAGVDSTDPSVYERDDDREHVDWLFGGRGESMLDYRPRVQPGEDLDQGWVDPDARLDPGLWFRMTRPYWHPDDVDDTTFEALRDDGAALDGILDGNGTAVDPDTAMVARPQHHQGVTWAYGGWGRKVHQLSVSSNPPDAGDRFMDWTGNYSLFTHCANHYGSDNVSRELRPHTDDVVHLMAMIAGAGPDLETLRRPGTSGFDQIAFVHPRIDESMGENTGAAFRDVQLTWGADLPGVEPAEDVGVTPGHRYDINIACGN